MFKCGKCNKITKPREKMHKKAISYRDRVYEFKDRKGNVSATYGREIVKEINLCEECFSKEK